MFEMSMLTGVWLQELEVGSSVADASGSGHGSGLRLAQVGWQGVGAVIACADMSEVGVSDKRK